MSDIVTRPVPRGRIMIAAALVLAVVGLVALAAAVLATHGPATVSLDKERYAVVDLATVTVDDQDLNVDVDVAETTSIALTSTVDTDGITLLLTETGANTGVFTGAATFATDTSTGTTLKVAAGDTITLSYEDADPAATVTDTATLLIDDGTVALDQTVYALGDTGTVTVLDVDRDTDVANADAVDVNITSESDPTGITVSAVESGASTGSFSASFTFTEGASSGTVLKVAPGDNVTASYVEPTFAGGTEDETDTAIVGTNGTASFDSAFYAIDDTATLTVADPDLTGASVDVTLKSTADPTGITVTLTGSDGSYAADVTFTEGASSGTTLQVAPGDALTLTYTDTATFDGPAQVVATATMYADGATVALDKDTYAHGDTATITVFDTDRDTDTGVADVITAVLTTTSDTVGVSVALTETGASTGTFTGSASLGTDAGLSAGDIITATYDEPTFAGGTAPRTDTAQARTDNATVTLDKTSYLVGESGTITVSDADRDATTSADSISVNVKSTTDPTGITVTLTETGASTGVFIGPVTFTSGASGGAAISTAAGDTVTVTYAEPLFEGGTADRTRTASITAPSTGGGGGGGGGGVIVRTLTIADTSVTEGDSGSVNAVFTVTMSSASASTTSVAFTTVEDTLSGGADAGVDYTTTSGTLTIAAGSTSGTVTVPVLGDTIDEVNETFFVHLSSPVGATLADSSATGTIVDDDLPEPEPEPGDGTSRVFGDDRIETAIAISQDQFGINDAGAVVLSRQDNFADALAGTALAIQEDGPLLLTPTSSLDSRTAAEIQRVLPQGGTVYILGGVAALSATVQTQLANAGYDVQRLSGETRYGTAVRIAEMIDSPTAFLVATGLNFPDALTAGAAAGHSGGAVLLTEDGVMPQETAAHLAQFPAVPRFAIGGQAASAMSGQANTTPLVGNDRYATAIAVAEEFFDAPTFAGVASGEVFADGLAGGAFSGANGGPLLLTQQAQLPTATSSYLEDSNIGTAVVFGGSLAVSDPVVQAITALVG